MSKTTTFVGVDRSEDGMKMRRPIIIVAEEEDSESESEDVIMGPKKNSSTNAIDDSQYSDLNGTDHTADNGGLASRKDINMPANEFAEGCKLLQAAALGSKVTMEVILEKRPRFVDFRDYDRRTAMHVAASEGHLEVCKFLVERGARINRSDRWGGSPLDDASRHRQKEVIQYLRSLGATTGSASRATNFIKAAAEGDIDEVETLLITGEVDVNEGDYDKRTALHLAAGEGNADIVRLLCKYKANVNTEDRWGNRPLDDAVRGKNKESAQILRDHGAKNGFRKQDLGDSVSRRREIANLEVNFEDLEMVDKIGKGSFGEIYRCRYVV
jgi:ankyrin repeat protein